MKLLITFLFIFLSFSARADSSYFIGLTFLLDGNMTSKNIGFTVKMLNPDQDDNWKFSIGGSVYPWREDLLGIDFGISHNSHNLAEILSYDFLQEKPAVGLGWVNN